jgi:hypothetical protein
MSALRNVSVITTALAVSLLGGCAQTQLYNPNATPQMAAQDNAACQFEAVRAAPLQSGGAIELAFSRNEIKRACLFARGYVEVAKAR